MRGADRYRRGTDRKRKERIENEQNQAKPKGTEDRIRKIGHRRGEWEVRQEDKERCEPTI